METYYKAINWNAIEDVIDKSTWEKLTRYAYPLVK